MQSSRDIILGAVRNQPTPRPAWLPFVGVHGAQLIGKTASEYLQSDACIVAGLKRAFELYTPDGLPIVFDLQMEAEVLGCQLRWSAETAPAVTTHPLEHGKLADLPAFDLSKGRFPVVQAALAQTKKDLGGKIALYGLITGPFTLALHLLGNDLFLRMFHEPDGIKEVVAFTTGVAKRVADLYLDGGADVVAVVDPMTSQISQEHFREFVAPYANDVFGHIRTRGGLSSLFVCGDAGRNLEAMCKTDCDNVSIDENIPLGEARACARRERKSFGGNLRVTSVLLMGAPDDARLDAIRCLDTGGSNGFILAPGCDLPFHAAPANIQAVFEMVQDTYKREVSRRTIIARAFDEGAVALPHYHREKDVYVDVITLDSSCCAQCQYIMEAAHRAGKAAGVPVHINEHRITTRHGIAMMRRLQVTSLPTICLDGQPEFASTIPEQNTLVAAIQRKAAAKKLR